MKQTMKSSRMLADLHCHTIFSGHAFSTLEENVLAARQKGMRLLGISDHGPSMVGACYAGHFEMGPRLPKNYKGLKLLFGCEANVINHDGEIDLSSECISRLDYLIVGLHLRTPYPARSSISENTLALVRAMKNYSIDMITHPFTQEFPVDVINIVNMAAQRQVALELNLSRLRQILRNPNTDRSKMELKAMKLMLKWADKSSASVVCGSDAHHTSELSCSANERKEFSTILERDIRSLFLNNNAELVKKLIHK